MTKRSRLGPDVLRSYELHRTFFRFRSDTNRQAQPSNTVVDANEHPSFNSDAPALNRLRRYCGEDIDEQSHGAATAPTAIVTTRVGRTVQ